MRDIKLISILSELNISDLISIIIAAIALYIAFKKSRYDEHREKNNLKFTMIDRCNYMIQHLSRNYELIAQIKNFKKRQYLYEVNDKSYKNVQEIYQVILDMKDSFDLKAYDSTLETIMHIEMQYLDQQKKILDHLNRRNPQ